MSTQSKKSVLSKAKESDPQEIYILPDTWSDYQGSMYLYVTEVSFYTSQRIINLQTYNLAQTRLEL